MRLHHLTVTAFGPFADTQQVDFEELNEAGLFLLTGATGAGKSSLLDAVCFALYGVVPGVRGTKTLKSQHAPADVAPEVVLDVTLQGRRFVVRRKPEWTRPKRRGDGVMKEKASASILETTDGDERLLTHRAAEVGVLVRSLMGMNATQFQQVALLPQGEFQTFLRATSQERHEVLEQLFRTDRFSRIEDWVHDRSKELSRRSRVGEAEVRRLVDTISDRAGAPTPTDMLGEALARTAADDGVLPWATAVLAEAQQTASAAIADQQRALTALVAARTCHEEARELHELRRRREEAERALARLDEDAPGVADARAALDSHERAVRCTTALELLDDARAARDRAAVELEATVPRAPSAEITETSLAADIEAALRRGALLQALLPREAAAAAAREAQLRDEALLREAEQRLHSAVERATALPAETAEAERAIAEATATAARADGLAQSLATAQRVHDAAVELVGVRTGIDGAEEARRDARDRAQDARDVVQDLTARRLAGMAAELAGALEEGVACPVCGGTDHPRPALATSEAVTDEDQAAADQVLTQRAAELEAADAALQALRTRHEVLVALAGDITPTRAAQEVAVLESELRTARDAGNRLEDLRQRLSALQVEEKSVTRLRTEAAADVVALQGTIAANELTARTAEDDIAAALADDDAGSVADATAATAETVRELSALLDAVRAFDIADRAATEAAVRADETAERHGFACADDVRAALLSEVDRTELASLLRQRADAEARALAVLEETTDESLIEEPLPLEQLRRDLDEAETLAAQSARTSAVHEERAQALRSQVDRLRGALDAWAPLRDEALRAASMAQLVRGMGHDNQLQMRLSAYVLATRLDQVVDAANERLGQMRDQRYLLQRTGRAQRRTGQAGLGLEVVDQWTGDVRTPATLSGGETFVVSLALALGLADVVTHEAAGAEVETLFVDEGFGTLDADTLDDVMDRLDGLRAGGRTVGVVSHVTELRTRIPTQVHVDKGRAGSTVTVRTLVG
jgi:DNA repair protein SbcC/Rad50